MAYPCWGSSSSSRAYRLDLFGRPRLQTMRCSLYKSVRDVTWPHPVSPPPARRGLLRCSIRVELGGWRPSIPLTRVACGVDTD
jgi:hypothetical protein